MTFGVKLHVWGEYACFTRPEMKVERVSYDVMTPSAARASGDSQPGRSGCAGAPPVQRGLPPGGTPAAG